MPTEAIALSQPRAQLDPHFTLRPLCLDEDVTVIHPWYQMDYAHYWNMQDMTLEATRDFYADALGSGHMRAFMGFYRGAPAFVMECYDPRHDPLGKRYAVQPGDLGMHFFVGPSTQPIRHFTRDVLRAVMAFLFDELGARRVVVERFGTEAYSTGLRVTTSLRAADQRAAHDAVQRGVLAFDRRGSWRGPEGQETLPSGNGAELERAAAEALKDHHDDETLRVAIVLTASAKEVRAQLATGERITLQGEGLRWAQRALQPAAKAPLKLQRGSVVRVVKNGKNWAISQWPEAEAALVALDTRTGRVRALVGGFDFTRQPFNHVTQGWRQPGSAIKPLLVSAALEERVMPATIVDDLPFTAANGWSPDNSSGDYSGPITLREGLAKSSNLVSVRVLQHVGTQRARDWTTRFGLDANRQPDNLTLALGTGLVTPLQMARAYATLANGGWRVEPVVVEKITDAQGKVLFEAPPPAPLTDESRAIPGRNAFVMSSLLNDVTRTGTAARAQAQLKRNDVYGKTGTTDDAVDAWFTGYHPTLATAVWMGYDKPRSLGGRESGGRAALPSWMD